MNGFANWRARGILPVLLLPLLIGCAQSGPPPANSSVARESLQVMLDSWQRGDAAEQLKDRAPPIVAVDDDWRAGLRLTKYQVNSADSPHGVALRSTVVLSLVDSDGKAVEKRAIYTIGTGPTITIVRSDREEEENAGS
jgi:hypothetical protein